MAVVTGRKPDEGRRDICQSRALSKQEGQNPEPEGGAASAGGLGRVGFCPVILQVTSERVLLTCTPHSDQRPMGPP